jgi:hypothetical protein
VVYGVFSSSQKVLRVAFKKNNLPNRRPRQNRLIRINYFRRIHLLGHNSNEFVAQGAALATGPEAFSCCVSPEQLRKRRDHLSSALSALAQNRVRNSRRISTSIFIGLKM